MGDVRRFLKVSVGIVLATAAALTVAIMLLYAVTAMARTNVVLAHVKGFTDEQNEWLNHLNSGWGPCCSYSEALVVVDPDWRMNDLDKCEMASNQINGLSSAPGNQVEYCVRLPGSPTWWAVTKQSVIIENNRIGPTLVWPMMAGPEGDRVLTYIRCFLPGAKA